MAILDAKSYIDLGGLITPNNIKKELTKFSTDILFTQVGLGEGPVYRINPNGPQDIRIDNKFIDDLINEYDQADPYVFQYKTTTGLVSQPPLIPFGLNTNNPIRFTTPIALKAGQINGIATDIPEANVLFFPTTVLSNSTPIDTIVLKFMINKLYRASTDNDSTEGNKPQRLDLRVLIHPRNEVADIDNYLVSMQRSFSEVIEFNTPLDIPISIPDADLTTDGYRVSIFKASDDSNNTAIASDVSFLGFDEVTRAAYSYPRTAQIGYALKATNFRSEVPAYSSLIKGLIVKVPSNYNQPILANGEVDWREIEVTDPSSAGYVLQDAPTTIGIDPNPIIYKGIWDGTFKYDWTQNPVWILYDLLTNTRYGLGISEEQIDKFNFYRAAQFCDAVDPNTGRFDGVLSYADGTFRHKPMGSYTSMLENQVGLPSSSIVLERRFIADVLIAVRLEVLDIISKLTNSMRSILTTNANKISLIVDYPTNVAEHLFTDSNIQSIEFSGIRKEDIVTNVEVVFFDGASNYEREVILVTDPELENLPVRTMSVELYTCTRRSQAQRFGQYLLASSKYLRRKVSLSTNATCDDLQPGAIVAISTQTARLNSGYNGIIQEASIGTEPIRLQHIGFPSISESFFTANSNPLVLRHFSNKSNKNELYLLSNTAYDVQNTGNSFNGFDYIEVSPTSKWDYNISTFVPFTSFDTFNNPELNDVWSLGEINPTSISSTNSDKLFRIDTISMQEDGTYDITATEHVSNVYIDSETVINYQPTPGRVIVNAFVPPPPPIVSITTTPIVTSAGAVTTVINFNFSTSAGSASVLSAFIPSFNIVPILGVAI
jgi:hypothetical protein